MAETETEPTLLDEVKTRLAITGTYHDTLLSAYIDDVKAYLKSAGVDAESISAVGVIARGVADLWNFGSGEGKFSTIFYERVSQMAIENSVTPPNENEVTNE